MKRYKFLIPVGIAASALAGSAVKADTAVQLPVKAEKVADFSGAKEPGAFVQHYTINGEEHTLLLRLGDQGVLYAQHESHSSHASHASHASHSSHTSGS
jgi:hypothetical protein